MEKDIAAIKSPAQLTSGAVAGYLSADFFIQALKKGGSSPTPEKVQAAASKMTFQIKGLVGPTKYPASTVLPKPSCQRGRPEHHRGDVARFRREAPMCI